MGLFRIFPPHPSHFYFAQYEFHWAIQLPLLKSSLFHSIFYFLLMPDVLKSEKYDR